MVSPATSPVISVVMPTFRRPAMAAAHAAAALAQIRTAARGAAELIVVDNCPDRSAAGALAPLVDAPDAPARYVAETQAGVANARNAGLAAARAPHVLFLDDDETPAPGWLAAFCAAAARGDAVAFGPIAPRYETPPDPARRPLLDRLYARDVGAADGADVSAHWVRFGTGNALFAIAPLRALGGFDARFNNTGGEDMRVIRQIMDQGARLRWVAEGWVEEIVPADRMAPAYLARRRFLQGQLRCRLIAAEAGAATPAKLAAWMGIGAGQAAVYGARALLARAMGRDAEPWVARMNGGVGKVMWRREGAGYYGGVE